MRSGRPAGSGSACVSAAWEPGEPERGRQACWAGQEGDVTTAANSPPHNTLILKAPLPGPREPLRGPRCWSQPAGTPISAAGVSRECGPGASPMCDLRCVGHRRSCGD